MVVQALLTGDLCFLWWHVVSLDSEIGLEHVLDRGHGREVEFELELYVVPAPEPARAGIRKGIFHATEADRNEPAKGVLSD